MDAEEMLTVLGGAFPADQPLAFAQAVCSRSRWAKSRAARQFRHVLELNAAAVLRKLGKEEEAARLLEERNKLPGL